ncbi:MAG: tRNA (N(6)-L-threonylcarbamoyladenosine(37)-C(2))-methylthiotransferase MtaB [Bdellovibrionales bacterium]
MSKDDLNSDVQYHTFGCKVNTYDTGLIQKNLKGLDTEKVSGTKKKIHILNTCAVTAEATKDAVRLTRRIKRDNPEAIVVVTGCSAQIDKKDFELEDSVDLLVANSHKEELKDLLQKKVNGENLEKFYHKNIFRKSSMGEGGGIEENHSRSFLKIQDGCDSFCSFCVIPHTRGKSRSLSLESIVKKIKEFVLNGQKEVVITGIHLGDYDDEGRNLEDMVEAILKETTLPRLRLTSLEPLELSPRLTEICKSDRVCSHFHMSVQSVNTKVLAAMKRKYTKEDVLESFKRAKSTGTDVFVGMDVIVGFPGETIDDFNKTYTALKESPYWDKIHVFPYSERPKTGATLLEGSVPVMERKRRSKALRELSKERFQGSLQKQIGKDLDVLVFEKKEFKGRRNYSQGLSRNYYPAVFPEGAPEFTEVKAKVIDVDYTLKAEGALICSLK